MRGKYPWTRREARIIVQWRRRVEPPVLCVTCNNATDYESGRRTLLAFLPSNVKSRNRAGNACSFEARPMLSTTSTDFGVNGKIVCEIDSGLSRCRLSFDGIRPSYVYRARRSEFKMKIELSWKRLSNVAINRISFESLSLTRQIRGATPLGSSVRVRKFCINICLNYIRKPKRSSEFRVSPQIIRDIRDC